ncbi:hypothetical protein NQ314_002951, partial [Rhamnusium bicolor]
TAAPYVLYKDGMDRTQAQWGPQDYPLPQQQTTSGAGSPHQVLGPTVPLGVEADTVPPRDQSLPSPAPSPYPATQAEQREDEIQPEQPTMDLEPRPASQCFSTDLQQQQQQQAYQQYARAPPPAAPPPVPPHMLGADVSPHLIFKNGINPTLWPQDVPFPSDEGKEEVQSTYGDGDSDRAACFSPNVKKHIDNHMNPHAAKTRRDSTGSESKLPVNGMLPRGLTPTTVVKPELYFPQCYAPSFNPPTSVSQFQTTNSEFKPPNPLSAQ